jgi:hypothetical protein
MHQPRSSWGKFLAFVALGALAALVGALLGVHGVTEDQLAIGSVLPAALFIGLQLKTGRLLIGRRWDITLAKRDENPRVFWIVVCVEGALCLLGICAVFARAFEHGK